MKVKKTINELNRFLITLFSLIFIVNNFFFLLYRSIYLSISIECVCECMYACASVWVMCVRITIFNFKPVKVYMQHKHIQNFYTPQNTYKMPKSNCSRFVCLQTKRKNALYLLPCVQAKKKKQRDIYASSTIFHVVHTKRRY